jgi:hypothetical protein
LLHGLDELVSVTWLFREKFENDKLDVAGIEHTFPSAGKATKTAMLDATMATKTAGVSAMRAAMFPVSGTMALPATKAVMLYALMATRPVGISPMKAAMFPVSETTARFATKAAVLHVTEILPGSLLRPWGETFVFQKAAYSPGMTFIHPEIVFCHW